VSKSKATLRRERTILEWSVLGVSILAIAAIAGGLIFYSFSSTSGAPDLRVSLRPEGGPFTLTVENKGGTTAEEVVVEVTRGDERQAVEFKAVAKGDTEEATVASPGDGQPTARVVSYKEP
jgi:uncharacterized protein (TIGR02588 family)